MTKSRFAVPACTFGVSETGLDEKAPSHDRDIGVLQNRMASTEEGKVMLTVGRWLLAGALMAASTVGWTGPVVPDVRMRLLDDYTAIGRPYQPVGDWKSPGELAVTLRVSLDDGSTVDSGSLRYDVQGDLIQLSLALSKPPRRVEDAGDEKACKPYVAGAELVYSLHHMPQREYRVELLGTHPVAPAPLHTLQRAKSEGLSAVFVISVPKDGLIVLAGRSVPLDELDMLFTRAEPYQIPVLVQSQSTSSLVVQQLATEHELPYQFPNYDKLLMKSVDETEAAYKAEDKGPPPGPWHPYGQHSKLPLSLSLSLPAPVVKSGTVPKFTVKVSNAGKLPVRIADLKSYRYLMANYLQLILTRSGARVDDIPVAIADAGPRQSRELTLLPGGGSMSMGYSGFPYMLDRLKPGRYEATLVFYFDEMYTSRYVESATLAFEVE
jgi:hypothetical protein